MDQEGEREDGGFAHAGEPRLRVRSVVKRFEGVTALAGVDMDIGPGEVLGLIGPNGSGKTTLVNCLSGVLKVDTGKIFLNGRDITTWSRVERARGGLARTFQLVQLFRNLTVRENITAGLNGRGRTMRHGQEDVIRSLLERFHLQRVAREVVTNLPYGDQRRVEIARALAANPSVLLLDEPAAGLNDAETAELLAVLADVRRDFGCSILLIDHDMSLVMKASHRIQVLDEGRVIFVGAPGDAFKTKNVVEAYLGAEE